MWLPIREIRGIKRKEKGKKPYIEVSCSQIPKGSEVWWRHASSQIVSSLAACYLRPEDPGNVSYWVVWHQDHGYPSARQYVLYLHLI